MQVVLIILYFFNHFICRIVKDGFVFIEKTGGFAVTLGNEGSATGGNLEGAGGV